MENRSLPEAQELTKTGTTTLGLVCKNGVVMGTEMRATMGHLISHKTTQKLFRIDDHIGLTVAGLVGDAQILARWLQAEVELFKVKRTGDISLKAASTLMANILNSRKFYPFYVQLLIGGVDKEGGHVYSLDAAGGSIPDKFTTTGSGSPFVYGVLEDLWKDDLTTDEGLDMGIRALTAAMKRDSASGDGIAICTITMDKGFQRLDLAEVDRRKKKMKLA
ncbi:MAG TPA: archaeal proteasome endopeptidase complex subunit beta [Candidatus Thermoplasmatota archaeon]|jgi:proteasome beta subunit|nr:archaeal proteasome endopeptidase complex subunit beta [Candidatus Thermoplasmatota archaeon]